VPSTTADGVKCVIVNHELREVEPKAWDFCVNFAKDNDLQMITLDARGQPIDG
jgi:hypothetical protein